MPVDDNDEPTPDEGFVPNQELLDQLQALAQQDPGPPPVVEEEDDFPTSMDFTAGDTLPPEMTHEEREAAADLPPDFPEEWREDFIGLLHLGYLQDRFEWLGHDFVIKTLSTNDLLEVGMLIKRYKDTLSESRAYSTAMVAAGLVSVDGRDLPLPISKRDESPLALRFDVVRDYYPITIDRIYERQMELEAKVQVIVEAMGKRIG